MKRYRFNLEAVLQQRKLVYEQRAKDFVIATNKLQLEQQRLADINHRQRETISAFNHKQRKGLTVRDSALYVSYLDRLAAEKKEQVSAVKAAEDRVSAARDVLNQARVRHEILVKMKEKSRDQYDEMFKREEQKFLDEITR